MSTTPSYEHSRVDEPQLSKLLKKIVCPLFRLFDRLFHSQYNPLYRSGTIAIFMFLILVVTGVYLLCFYKVGSPYESVASIHNSIFLGKILRTLHRYATDLGIVAILFHFLQIALQGKTWGPRTLAWISGVIMLVFFYIAAWTGYVMVWDEHGQLLAQAGADLIQTIPLISEPVTQAFSGEKALPDAFFFMNLFMHVAVPLLFVIGLWIHTARIKRTQWLPPKSILYGISVLLLVFSILFPAPLLEKANLLNQIGVIPIDLFLSYWVPWIDIFGVNILMYGGIGLFLFCITASLWWKPKIALSKRISVVDEALCTGCTQCAVDCPYEAISMVPFGERNRLLAEVSPTNCVSCGICSASCSDFAVGPPNRNGIDQAKAALILREKIELSSHADVIIAYCSNNPGIEEELKNLHQRTNKRLEEFPLQCAGTIHNETLTNLLKASDHVIIWGCAERVCMNRDGIVLLRGRFERTRVPFLDKKIDRSHATLITRASWEVSEILKAMEAYPNNLSEVIPLSRKISALIFGALLIFVVIFASRISFGVEPLNGIVRVAGSLPAVTKSQCRQLTEEERNTLSAHMQRHEICEEKHRSFKLSVKVDGFDEFTDIISPGGLHKDRPVYLNKEIEVSPGNHTLSITLDYADSPNDNSPQFHFEKTLTITPGEVLLFVPDSLGQSFKNIAS